MQRKWIGIKSSQVESDNDNNSDKENRIDDGEVGDFKELTQEQNMVEVLDEPVRQSLANILETVWQNPQTCEKMKGEMEI